VSSGASRIAVTLFADRGSTTCECAAVAMKAHGVFSTPALGQIHADTLRNHVNTMGDDTDLSTSNSLIFSNGQQS